MTYKEEIMSDMLKNTDTLTQLIYLSQTKEKKDELLTYCPHCIIYKRLGIDKIGCQQKYNKGGGCFQCITYFLESHKRS